MPDKQRVLILRTGNSSRSCASSASTSRATVPKSVDEFRGQPFDSVLTVCDSANESCPIFPGQTVTIHHNFADPAATQGSEAERLALFRRIRDEIHEFLKTFAPPPNPSHKLLR